MANLIGRAIANASCSDCGKPVRIKVSKGSKAYYYCPHVSAETGEYCGNRKWWGVDASQRMQRDYLDARNAPKPAPAQEQDEHDDREPTDLSNVKEIETEAETGNGYDRDYERDGYEREDDGGWGLYS